MSGGYCDVAIWICSRLHMEFPDMLDGHEGPQFNTRYLAVQWAEEERKVF